MSTKARIQKVLAEVEAHEERGWLKGYEEGLATREKQIVDLESALEAKNQKIRELNHRKKAPKTAWEALDLAWELAHPVKEGQVIPEGDVLLSGGRDHFTCEKAYRDTPVGPSGANWFRTLDPLPKPEPDPELPDWLDAPAVIAIAENFSYRRTWLPVEDGYWASVEDGRAHWSELTDVTPLYPKKDA